MRKHRTKFNRLISLLLTVVMILATAIPAFGAVSMQDKGGSANFGTGIPGNTWSRDSQFIRVTVLWAPYAKDGDTMVDADGITWQPNKVKFIGDTFDWANGDGNNPWNTVYKHSNFTSAYEYNRNGHVKKISEGGIKYTTYGRAWEFTPGSLKSDSGAALTFPRRVGGANNVVTRDFFQQRSVLNEVLFMTKETPTGRTEKGYGAGIMNVDRLKSGMYMFEDGTELPGKYLIMVEPGAYMPVNGIFTAYTLRDALAWGHGGPTSKAPSVVGDLANALQLESNAHYADLGLEYSNSQKTFGDITNTMSGQFPAIRKYAGVGLVWFVNETEIPVINYFYNLKESEIERDAAGNVIKIKPEAFERGADASSKVMAAGTTYTAPAKSSADGVSKTHILYQGYLSNKDELQGNLDKSPSEFLPYFINSSGNRVITDAAKDYVGYDFTQNDIAKWGTARDMVSTVSSIAGLTGITSKSEQIHANGKGELVVNYGKAADKVQSNFLYINLPEIPPTTPDDSNIDFVTVKPGTNVTKMYYETPEDTAPSSIKSEPVGKEESYKIPSKEDTYEMTEWVLIPDTVPGKPDPVKDFDEASNKQIEGGSTPDTITPDKWSDPDSELVIKFVKKPGETNDGELYLPEKRISWLKSLEDIGGRPTITFSWADNNAEETHYCDSDNCSGHDCTRGIGPDSQLRLLASNTSPVANQIMGEKPGFTPFDSDNEIQRGATLDAGEEKMNPNYTYVIWRGKDIPTIASYKYKSAEVPKIKGLIGTNMIGIQPQGARHPNNNSYYMDSFSIDYGKAYYDTRRYESFKEVFGELKEGNANAAEQESALHPMYEDWLDKVDAHKKAQSELESAKKELDDTPRWSTGYNRAKKAYENAVAAEQAAKNNRIDSANSYNKQAAILGPGREQLDAELTGKKETGKDYYGDYDYAGTMSYCGDIDWFTVSGDSTTYNADVRVDVGYGSENIGNTKVEFDSQNLKAFGKDFKNVQGFAINNTKGIEFYPYVEQFYDTTDGTKDGIVYTLGGHKSTFVPRDYVEIGYIVTAANSETQTGLVLQSKQWSTHQAALKLSGGKKNVVLPGGAIYRLQTPGSGSANSRTKIAMSSWLTFLPADTIDATIAGKDYYNGTAQNNRNEALYREVLNSLNSLDIVQVVGGTTVLQEQAGAQRVPGTSGQPTSKDAKYWLNQNIKDGTGSPAVPSSVDEAVKINSVKPNEADLDIIKSTLKEERIYYRVYSDVKGNVYVSKSKVSADDTKPGSGTILGKITKQQSLSDLTAQNSEIAALNNRTKLVENFINSIDRNTGNDVSIADSKWYNEAWDGICVVRINKFIEIGFRDQNENNAVRTAALDPKLQTKRASQGDMYKTSIDSWFETDKHTNYSTIEGYVGTFDASGAGAGKIQIKIKDMNGLYRSKVFKIPNVSVMELF